MHTPHFNVDCWKLNKHIDKFRYYTQTCTNIFPLNFFFLSFTVVISFISKVHGVKREKQITGYCGRITIPSESRSQNNRCICAFVENTVGEAIWLKIGLIMTGLWVTFKRSIYSTIVWKHNCFSNSRGLPAVYLDYTVNTRRMIDQMNLIFPNNFLKTLI